MVILFGSWTYIRPWDRSFQVKGTGLIALLQSLLESLLCNSAPWRELYFLLVCLFLIITTWSQNGFIWSMCRFAVAILCKLYCNTRKDCLSHSPIGTFFASFNVIYVINFGESWILGNIGIRASVTVHDKDLLFKYTWLYGNITRMSFICNISVAFCCNMNGLILVPNLTVGLKWNQETDCLLQLVTHYMVNTRIMR